MKAGSRLSLNAKNLFEGVNGFNQVELVIHNLVDVFVSAGDFVDAPLILAAFHALGLSNQVFPGKLPAPCAQEQNDFSLPLPRTM